MSDREPRELRVGLLIEPTDAERALFRSWLLVNGRELTEAFDAAEALSRAAGSLDPAKVDGLATAWQQARTKADLTPRPFQLRTSLHTAVPLWLIRLAGMSLAGRESLRRAWARAAADAVVRRGDAAAFTDLTGEGGAADADALARGLAALAAMPGGVRFLGILWCIDHHPKGMRTLPGENVEVCPTCIGENQDAVRWSRRDGLRALILSTLSPDRRYL